MKYIIMGMMLLVNYSLYSQIIIPPGTRAIQDEQFREMNINSVEIPDTVTHNGDFALFGNNLAEVRLPENLRELGVGTFRNNRLISIWEYF